METIQDNKISYQDGQFSFSKDGVYDNPAQIIGGFIQNKIPEIDIGRKLDPDKDPELTAPGYKRQWSILDLLVHGDPYSTSNANERKRMQNEVAEQNKYVNERKAIEKAGLNPATILEKGTVNAPQQSQESKQQGETLLLGLLKLIMILGK